MKFIVTKDFSGREVDVRLHWESKDKIKKVLWWTVGAVSATYLAVDFGLPKLRKHQ